MPFFQSAPAIFVFSITLDNFSKGYNIVIGGIGI